MNTTGSSIPHSPLGKAFLTRKINENTTFDSSNFCSTHPLGQTLIVTADRGLAQRWGVPVEQNRPGDVIWCPPGEKHWHDATATTAMTQIAIVERLDGKSADWMEKFSDKQHQTGLRGV
jgi:hypothetical protein